MVEVFTFQQALECAGPGKKNLLLGNGFSIACEPRVFSYSSLYEQAQKSAFVSDSELQTVFEVLGTNDFELAIRALEFTAKLAPIYVQNPEDINQALNQHPRIIKDALIRTIAENHPGTPHNVDQEKFYRCRKFLSYFIGKKDLGRVYTLNYDLLLYWAIMHDEIPVGTEPIELVRDDGFRANKNNSTDYVVWNGEDDFHQQNIHYLHGAVHIFDNGNELKKYTWLNTGTPLLNQVRRAMEQSMFPLFVAEGESLNKLSKINHNAYLHHSFKSFSRVMQEPKQSVFIYGHSLADNDQHILNKIGHGRTNKLFVSLYGNKNSNSNKTIIRKAQALASMREERHPLEISFFDAQSAEVW